MTVCEWTIRAFFSFFVTSHESRHLLPEQTEYLYVLLLLYSRHTSAVQMAVNIPMPTCVILRRPCCRPDMAAGGATGITTEQRVQSPQVKHPTNESSRAVVKTTPQYLVEHPALYFIFFQTPGRPTHDTRALDTTTAKSTQQTGV